MFRAANILGTVLHLIVSVDEMFDTNETTKFVRHVKDLRARIVVDMELLTKVSDQVNRLDILGRCHTLRRDESFSLHISNPNRWIGTKINLWRRNCCTTCRSEKQPLKLFGRHPMAILSCSVWDIKESYGEQSTSFLLLKLFEFVFEVDQC